MHKYKISMTPVKANFELENVENIDIILEEAKDYFNSRSIGAKNKKIITDIERKGNIINCKFESEVEISESNALKALRVFSGYIKEKDIIPLVGNQIFKRCLYKEFDSFTVEKVAGTNTKEILDMNYCEEIVLSKCKYDKEYAKRLICKIAEIL